MVNFHKIVPVKLKLWPPFRVIVTLYHIYKVRFILDMVKDDSPPLAECNLSENFKFKI